MPTRFADRAYERSSTTGTGSLVLGGAVLDYRSLFASFGVGVPFYYVILNQFANEWEVGSSAGLIDTLGVYSMPRTTVIESSNAGALVNFSAGLKEVRNTLPASVAARFASGPTVAVDNALTRYDGTTGLLLQSSNWLLNDVDKLKGYAAYSDIVTVTGTEIDLNLGNTFYKLLTSSVTLTVVNYSPGQKFSLKLLQDGVGGHTVNWWGGITWADYAEPVLRTAATLNNWIGFVCTSATPEFDGFSLSVCADPTEPSPGGMVSVSGSISFGDASPISLFSLVALARVELMTVVIDTPYDTAATITIGTAGDPDKYTVAADIDLQAPAGTRFTVTQLVAANSALELIRATYASNSATVGEARVIMNYAAPA